MTTRLDNNDTSRPSRCWAVWRAIVGTLALAGLCTLGWASSVDSPLAGTAEDRIVVFGDVHGGATELIALLRALRLVDDNQNWIGGSTRLVSLGDLLDRGPDSRAVMDLLMKLETQAGDAGGRLHLVLGNHEIMNLTGDLRYVAPAEYAAFAGDEDGDVRARELAAFQHRRSESARPAETEAAFNERYPPGFFAHRAAFKANGQYGAWLLTKPQILVLERTAFVHGGLSEAFIPLDIDEYNHRAASELNLLLETGERLTDSGDLWPWTDLLAAEPVEPDAQIPENLQSLRQSLQFDTEGPSWYRGTASCHALLEQSTFEAVLDARGLDRVVMGHTPTNPRIIQSRFSDRAILADTGMYGAYYRGRPSAVVIDGAEMNTLTLNADGVLETKLGRPAIDVRAGSEASLLKSATEALASARFDASQVAEMVVRGRRMEATWHQESRRERSARLAAFALDKVLGFGLIAPVVEHERDGREGTVEIIPAGAINESKRSAEQLYRPNYCGQGSDFDLMLIIDGLLGQEVRTGENLLYDHVTWLIYLTGQNKAFPTSHRLPRYLTDRQIQIAGPVVERLARLTIDTLEEALGDYLNKRQLEAILARRSLLLAKWPETVR